MESRRKLWNKRQTEFRKILLTFAQHEEAIQLFFGQHAALHSAQLAQAEGFGADYWSYEDEILDGLNEESIRRIPNNNEHSVAWLLWHMARIEDVAMNMLVAGSPQIMHRDNWPGKLNVSFPSTGNAMDADDVNALSAAIDIESLRAYRLAVGRRTVEIVKTVSPEELKQKVDPSRLQQIMAEGAIVEQAYGLIEYWGKRNIAGLLLMPATRHNFVHLNEASKLIKRRS